MITRLELSSSVQMAAKAAIERAAGAFPAPIGHEDLVVSPREKDVLGLGMLEVAGTTYYVGTKNEPVRP